MKTEAPLNHSLLNPTNVQAPLAFQMRPTSLGALIGQTHLLTPGKPIYEMIQSGQLVSFILWGPPGTGKTSIAHVIAHQSGQSLSSLSALDLGTQAIKQHIDKITQGLCSNLLFVDEIHRLNKAQQDIFLPHLESGKLILIGATTENPSFTLNHALLSRCQVYPLNPLDENDLLALIDRALLHLNQGECLTDEAKNYLARLASGDARFCLNALELAQSIQSDSSPMTLETFKALLQHKSAHYDSSGDMHYNLISALHKSIRGSNPQAALYWLARMLEGGEDRLYIIRRLVRCAIEDIGLADPNALVQANQAHITYQMLGSPEGDIVLYQLVIFLSLSPKSNSVYTSEANAKALAKRHSDLSPPHNILNAPTKLMKEMGYSQGYIYDHDTPEGFSGQSFLPESLANIQPYSPIDRGFERELKKRLDYFNRLKLQLTLK